MRFGFNIESRGAAITRRQQELVEASEAEQRALREFADGGFTLAVVQEHERRVHENIGLRSKPLRQRITFLLGSWQPQFSRTIS